MIDKFITSFLEKRNRRNKRHYLQELESRGMKIGNNLYFVDKPFDWSYCYLIELGNDVGISSHVTILAHDASTKEKLGYSKIGKVILGDRVFVGASSIILPGVSIGNDVIIGAGTVVTKSIASGKVVCGNPAREICSTEDYINKNRISFDCSPIYDTSQGLNSEMINQMQKDLEGKMGYDV